MAVSRGSAGSASATRRKAVSASRMNYYGEESSMIELSPVGIILGYFSVDGLSVKEQGGCLLVVVDRILLLVFYVHKWMVVIRIINYHALHSRFFSLYCVLSLFHSLLSYKFTTELEWKTKQHDFFPCVFMYRSKLCTWRLVLLWLCLCFTSLERYEFVVYIVYESMCKEMVVMCRVYVADEGSIAKILIDSLCVRACMRAWIYTRFNLSSLYI